MKQRYWIGFCVTMGLLLTTLLGSAATSRRVVDALAVPLDQISSDILNWRQISEETLPAPSLRALKPTSYLVRRYRKGSLDLDVFIAYYAQQRGGESMHSPKHCLPGSGWEIWQHGAVTIPVDQRQVEINRYSIANSGRRQLMFYWYQSRDRIIASEYIGKLFLARDALLSGHTGGSIVRISLPDVPGANEEGTAFASALQREMQRCLGN